MAKKKQDGITRDSKHRKLCEHNRRLDACVDCGGNQICEHHKRRYRCTECSGPGICEHGITRDRCIPCKGAQVCEHNHIKRTCKKCRGPNVCEHDNLRDRCKQCGGFSLWARLLYNLARRRSVKHSVSFDLDIGWIEKRLRQGCPIFKVPFNSKESKKEICFTATIDRFYPERGYTKENSFVVSHLANRVKSNATTQQVQAVASWMKQVEDSMNHSANKNMSASYKKAYMQESVPDYGTSTPAGKANRGCDDTLKAKHTTETVQEAKTTDPNRLKEALNRQLGRHTDTCRAGDPGREGGKLGNATNQPEDGVNDTPPSK